MPRYGLKLTKLGLSTPALLSKYDPDAQAFMNAMDTQPDEARLDLINDLFLELKDNNVYSGLTWLSLFNSHSETTAKVNIIRPAQSLTVVGTGSPTFTTDVGFTGNGTSRLDSGQKATVQDPDNCSLFSQVVTTAASSAVFCGARNASHSIQEGGATSPAPDLYAITAATIAGASANDIFHIVTRNGTTQEYEAYTLGTDSRTVTSTTAPNSFNISALGTGNGLYSTAELANFGFGTYLNKTRRDALKTALDNYTAGL